VRPSLFGAGIETVGILDYSTLCLKISLMEEAISIIGSLFGAGIEDF
jgi:hypothetical protein